MSILDSQLFDDSDTGVKRLELAYSKVSAALPAIKIDIDHRTVAQYDRMSAAKPNPSVAVCKLLFQKRALQGYTYHLVDIARCHLLKLQGDLAASRGQRGKAVQYYVDARDAFVKAKHPANARLCDLRARWIQHQRLPVVLSAVTFGVMCLAGMLQLLLG